MEIEGSRMNYDPADEPLAWLTDGTLVIGHAEQYSKHDVYMPGCSGSGFYAVRLDGGPARPLAVGGAACPALARDWGTAVGPDGQWAIFSQRAEPNSSHLARLDFATGRVDTLRTGCAVYLERPSISADGRRIAARGLCRDPEQEDYALYVMNADGSGLRHLLQPGRSAGWSPDGRWLAAGGDSGIVVMAPDGSGRRVITTGGGPAWSPDGRWIAFYDDYGRQHSGIFLIRPDGTGRRLLFRNRPRGTYSRGWGSRPEGEPVSGLVWSPDSRWIAFSRVFDAGTSVWRVEVATGYAQQVTRPDH